MNDSTLPRQGVISWLKQETKDTFTLSIVFADQAQTGFLRFIPGQFNMLAVPYLGEAPISISSAPDDRELTHTIRVAGDVTAALSRLKSGDRLGIRGPFGNGWPLPEIEECDLLLIAGGLGIAPLRSVIRHVMAHRNCCRKRPLLLYGAKTPKEILFRNEIPRFRQVFDILLTVDRADPQEHWRDPTGTVGQLLETTRFDPLTAVAFICGPEVMMTGVAQQLLRRGVPPEKIFVALERHMNCGTGICGHCIFGPILVCKDGPVFRYQDIRQFLGVREL